MVRDYTDDIYAQNPSREMFVESFGSDLFVNMLVVLHQDKVQQFTDKMEDLMTEYYAHVDGNEQRKIDERAKMTLHEMREKADEKWDEFVERVGRTEGEEEEQFDERARAALSQEMLAALEEK